MRVRRWALQRYIAGLFLQMVVLCFTVLLTAYLIVDVLERLQWFAKHGAEGGEILRFYGARIPLLASRVVPMSLLVGTALTVGLLAVQGELMAIQSCGISALRALAPALVICGAVAPASFYLTNNIVPRTNALADYLKQTEIKKADDDRLEARRRRDVWSRSGRRFFEAERFDPKLGAARNITVYELGDDGLPRTRADARGGRHIGGGVWRMVEPFRVERSSAGITRVPAATFAELGEEISAEVDTMHLSVGELRSEIRDVQEGGYDSTVYEVDLFMKLAAPFACLVLPALALFFCISGPPFPSSAASLVLSAGVAVGYTLLSGIARSLGYGGAIAPSVAGWAPTLFFGAVALYLGLRLRGFGQRH